MRVAAPVAIAVAMLALTAAYGLDSGHEIRDAGSSTEVPANDPLGPNAACYVCHMTFVREELAKTHLEAGVTCIACHGLSKGHANDEDIGATKPDIVFARDAVNDSCRECHPAHDVAPEAVVARWLERRLTQSPPVCTDCHGSHRIERPAPESAAEGEADTRAAPP